MSESNGTTTPAFPLRLFSALVNRVGLANRIGSLFDGRRNIHEILGYKPRLTYGDFKARYLRQDLAQRLIKIYPDATWNQPPQIVEEHEGDLPTPFETAWSTLAAQLRVWAMLHRADILAQLGRYAVLLIGLAGQSDLAAPARPVRSVDDVLYLEPYSEEWAEIQSLDSNPGSPTFGRPATYRINFARSGPADQGKTVTRAGTATVHASRVIHLAADDLLDDEVYGIPGMESVFDRLDDLLKVVGGSCEMIWRDGKRRIALEVRDDYRLEAADEDALTDEALEFSHDLKDFLRVKGVDVKSLSGAAVDPEKHFSMLVDILCAARGVPKRKLLGSERGELASSQDERNWREHVSTRQMMIAEPRYMRPLIDRLLLLRALPAPAQPYQVVFENLLGLSEDQQATIAQKVASAVHQFAQADATGLNPVTREAFVTEYLGLSLDAMAEVLDMEPGEDEEQEETQEDEEGEEAPGEREEAAA